jgi:hypothetical protein
MASSKNIIFQSVPVKREDVIMVTEDEVAVMLRIYSHALELAVEGDKARGIELLQQSADEQGLEIPAVACDMKGKDG